MRKAKVVSMQGVTALWTRCSIKIILIKRAADMCHMYADLMGTACAQLQFYQTQGALTDDKAIISAGVFPVG